MTTSSPVNFTIQVQQSRILKLESEAMSTLKELSRLNAEVQKNRENTLELMNRLRLAHNVIESLADRVSEVEKK